MSTVFVVPRPLAGSAIDNLGFTWAFASNDADHATWPALVGTGIALALSGDVDLDQRTPGLEASGAGSARIDTAVVARTNTRWLSPATFPNPLANPVWIRLILREVRRTGTATYFEISQAAQRFTIRRNVETLQITGALGTYTETIDLAPFLGESVYGAFMLLDVISSATGFSAFLNGVDLTPSFTGGALVAFAGAAAVALQSNVAGSDAAANVALIFAGIGVSNAPTIEQHRIAADHLGVLAEQLAIEGLGGFTWAWSPNRIDKSTAPAPTLPGEPDFGDVAARLNITGELEVEAETDNLRPEGLGRPRLDRAMRPTDTDVRVYRGAPSGLEAIDGDVHLRLIFRVDSTGIVDQRFFYLTDEFDATRLLGIEVDPVNGDLTLHAPNAYDLTLAAAVARDRWHLLDVSLDRDNGSGNAQFVVQLDGAAIAAAAFVGPVDDVRVNAAVTIFDDMLFAGAATETRLVFVAVTRGRIMTLARHVVDALALGVVP